MALNPRAQLGFSRYSLGGFREAGGETAFGSIGLKVTRLESRLGAKLDGTANVAGWTIRPHCKPTMSGCWAEPGTG